VSALVAHPPNAALVERIFEEAIKGRTAAKIAEQLAVDSSIVRAAMREPAFKANVAQYRAEVLESTLAQLHAAAELSVSTLLAVQTGKIKGAGASAAVKSAEAILDRIGLTRSATADAARSPEAERLVAVFVQVLARHPEANAEAVAMIEAEVIGERDPH
jgi:GTP-sensing pleiotropic transcriptional regulator CodY